MQLTYTNKEKFKKETWNYICSNTVLSGVNQRAVSQEDPRRYCSRRAFAPAVESVSSVDFGMLLASAVEYKSIIAASYSEKKKWRNGAVSCFRIRQHRQSDECSQTRTAPNILQVVHIYSITANKSFFAPKSQEATGWNVVSNDR